MYDCRTHGLIPDEQTTSYKSPTCKSGFRQICLICVKIWRSNSYKRSPETSKAYVRNWKQSHPERAKEFRDKLFHNPEWNKAHLERSRQRRWNQKIRIINHYGGVCVRCDERTMEFLCLDHINDDGKEHRKITGKGGLFYKWIVKNNFPDCGVQVLCHNCNQRKQSTMIVQLPTGPNARYARFRSKLKASVIAHYSPTSSCACCGESDPIILSMDHINGGGNVHRRETGHLNLFVWLKKNKFPSGLRVLCHNCNFSFGAYGRCLYANVGRRTMNR